MSRLRAWVAVAAAYALALQVILTGIPPMAAASAVDPSAICYGDAGGDDHKPDGAPVAHQTCIICSVAPAASLPSSLGAPIAWQFANAVEFNGLTEPSGPVRRLHSPRSSQGPPQIA